MLNFNPSFRITVFVTVLLLIFIPLSSWSQSFPVSDFDPSRLQVIAFPGAEGFGKFASGGRGGQVLKVTNLNDSGPGSLRDAVTRQGPRIVVFEVSGTIYLQTPINVTSPDLTIAGQTAPGDGITIANSRMNFTNARNIIIRYLRFRPGDSLGLEQQAGYGVYIDNAIFDHCSFSWGTDEIASFYAVRNFTMQWCMISEALNNSVHSKGIHGYGAIAGGKNVSWHHNLLAHAIDRMSMFDHMGLYRSSQELQDWRGITDFRNNVVYNWQNRAASNGDGGNFNLINNFFKPGPATTAAEARDFFLSPTSTQVGTSLVYGKFFVNGNILNGNAGVNSNNWAGVRLENSDLTQRFLESTKLSTPLASDVYSYTPSAQEAYLKVLDHAGASFFRDAVDTRIVQETRNGTFTFTGSRGSRFGIIDSQRDVGGWPTLRSLPALADTDQDGMPDSWETANGLNPNRSNDREFNLSPYYTDIEVYINSLVDNSVKNQYPTTPLVVNPLIPSAGANNIPPVEISFAWENVPNADTYQVQLSKSATFASGNITLSNIRNLSLVYPQLDANSTYYWRVRALRSGVTGPYSATRSFQTGSLNAAPGQPVLLEPKNGSEGTSLSPVFSWSKVPNAVTYDLQISTSSSFSTTIVNQTGLNGTSFQSPRLLENQSYFWRVRARNTNGTGSYSTTGSFKTVSLASVPGWVIPIRPTNGVTVNPVNIVLEWENLPAADSYRVQLSTNSSFSSPIIDRSGISERFFNIPNLNSNTTYYWRVVGVNRSGTGWYSPNFSVFKTSPFTQPPTSIQLADPVDDSNLFSTSITFSWIADPIAQNYTLQVSTREDFGTFVANLTGLTSTSRTISNLQANTQYFWRVWGTNDAGNSQIGEVRKVRSATASTVPGAAQLTSPANNGVVSSQNVVFRWENQPNTEFYRIEVSESINFSSLVFARNSIRGTSWVVPQLTANRTYYWRVRTYNPRGTGPYSSISAFRTASGAVSLTQPTLASPSNAATNQPRNLTLRWNTVENADSYEVQVSETNTFSTLSFSQTALSNSNANFPNLAEGKTYFWRVRAKAGSTDSNWSGVWNFTTQGQTEANSLDVGLVGFWTMEEGSGMSLLDQSGRNNHLALQNTTGASWVPGVEGSALSLNGNTNSFARVPHNSSLEIPNAVSMSAWVRPNTVHRGTILYKSAGNGFELWFTIDGKIEFRLNRTSNGTTYRILSNFSYSASLNQWLHVAATFDGSTMKIYVNGVEDISRTYSPFTIGTISGNLVLASMDGIQRWQGLLDEVRLYNRALSKEEVTLAMNGSPILETPTPIPSNLVGHWKMDEGNGNQLIDHSGQVNNANVANTSGMSWIAGRDNLGLRLGGNNVGLVPHHPSLEFSNAITVAVWIKPTAVGRRTIVSKGSPDGFFLRTETNGKIEFRFNANTNGTQFRVLSNQSYPTNGTWMHVAVTFDGTRSTMYINGVQDNTASYSPSVIRPNTTNLQIGAWDGINRYSGDLDDLRLYSSVLSASEVLNLVNSGQQAMRSNSGTVKGQSDTRKETSDGENPSVQTSETKEEQLQPTLYPNPVVKAVTVRGLWLEDGPIRIAIYDMNGRLKMESESMVANHSLSIDISDLSLSAGNYVLVLQDNFHREVIRFLKK